MNLTITKWLLVYVCEHKHNFYVIHFLSVTVKLKGLPGLSLEMACFIVIVTVIVQKQ